METWRGLFRCSRVRHWRFGGKVTLVAALWLWLQIWIAAKAWDMPRVDMHVYAQLCLFFAWCNVAMAALACFDLRALRADVQQVAYMEQREQRLTQRRQRATPVEIDDAGADVISLERYRSNREREAEPRFAPIIEVD